MNIITNYIVATRLQYIEIGFKYYNCIETIT